MNPPPGWRLQRFETIESTSDLCATLAQAGEPAGLAVLAARQTHGRGSRGRQWETLPGNLALSVLLRPSGPAVDAGQWALLAAVALAEALEAAAPGVTVRLKWPNDALLDGRKLGGILIDTALNPAGRLAWLVIGFGANLVAAPELAGKTAGCLPHAPCAVLAATLTLQRLNHWAGIQRRDGFGPVRQAWLQRGPTLGDWLRLGIGASQVGGTFAGLSDTGALLLHSGGRVHAFATGQVLQAGE